MAGDGGGKLRARGRLSENKGKMAETTERAKAVEV